MFVNCLVRLQGALDAIMIPHAMTVLGLSRRFPLPRATRSGVLPPVAEINHRLVSHPAPKPLLPIDALTAR